MPNMPPPMKTRTISREELAALIRYGATESYIDQDDFLGAYDIR